MDRTEGAAGPARHGGWEQDRASSVLARAGNRQFSAPDAVDAAIAGEQEAERLLRCVRDGMARPDEFLHALRDVLLADGVNVPATPRLRGFSRRLQKSMEAGR